MKSKPYPAFGYTILLNTFDAGEAVTDEMMRNNIFEIYNPAPGASGDIGGKRAGYVWYMVSGVQSYRNIDTNQVELHEPGWCNLVHELTPGTYEFSSVTDSEFVCFSTTINSHKTPSLPELEFVAMDEGEERVFPKGTKLYVLDGELAINQEKIGGMRQVHIKSADTRAIARKRTRGLIFKV